MTTHHQSPGRKPSPPPRLPFTLPWLIAACFIFSASLFILQIRHTFEDTRAHARPSSITQTSAQLQRDLLSLRTQFIEQIQLLSAHATSSPSEGIDKSTLDALAQKISGEASTSATTTPPISTTSTLPSNDIISTDR